MPPPTPTLPAEQPGLDALLRTLLDASTTGVAQLGPVYAAGLGEELLDFSYERLNPAAQRLLGLPEHPATSYRALAPTDAAGLAFLRATFLSGAAGHHTLAGYTAAGQPYRLRVAGQRVGERLVASLTPEAPLASLPPPAPAQWPQLLEQAPVAIAVLHGPRHRVALANPAICALWRRTHEQVLGRPLFEVLPEAAGHGLEELLAEVLATGRPYVAHETPSRFLRGEAAEPVYLNFVYQPLHQPDNLPASVLVVMSDVSEQVRGRLRTQELNTELRAVNEQLHQLNQELECRVAAGVREAQAAHAEAETQRQRLARFFQQAPAAICVLDGPDLVYELVNPGYQQFFPGRQLLGRPLREAAPELLTQPTYAWMRQVYDTGHSHEGHEVRLCVNGPGDEQPTEHYFNCVYQPRHDEQGRTDGVLAFALDVTTEVRAQQQVAALQTEARAAAERLAQERETSYQVFEQTPAAVALMWGPAHRFEYVNAAFSRLFPGRELRYRSLAEALPEAEPQGFVAVLDQVYRTGEALVADEVPLTIARPAAPAEHTEYFNFAYQPYRESGQTLGVSVFAYNVTAQVLARQQLSQALATLQQTNGQLRRTNVDLDNFIYTASHDLKAPIANIEGLLLLLREQLPAEVRQAGLVPRVLGMMQGAIERFQVTIAQLTDIAKLQQAHTQPAEEVDLRALAENVRLDLAPLLEEAHAELHVSLDSCATISFAPQHLRSIFYNLLTNAIKYRHPARPLVVHLRCRSQPGAILLEVHDNGLGLTPEQQSKLFGMFRRLHAHVPGSGMGLYMVKRIVENAGGTIEVQSQPHAGSTFTVSLPA
ncbi:MAG TPA: PAS domain-containing protein [Hymenobacter sp.]|uniref:PAS domain-containing protein n=1 Tax=Hymenobacter sp. TaxID=1898978 RepID=UPI002D8034D8|nr:PAS domain-containing protein [Hymenobacter sp.]HET9506225.1 PAS domain-containing protein [Hymenobacter sp.]